MQATITFPVLVENFQAAKFDEATAKKMKGKEAYEVTLKAVLVKDDAVMLMSGAQGHKIKVTVTLDDGQPGPVLLPETLAEP